MTTEELEKVPFHFVSHMSMEDEHTTTYASEDGKVYKTKKKFIEAIKEL